MYYGLKYIKSLKILEKLEYINWKRIYIYKFIYTLSYNNIGDNGYIIGDNNLTYSTYFVFLPIYFSTTRSRHFVKKGWLS